MGKKHKSHRYLKQEHPRQREQPLQSLNGENMPCTFEGIAKPSSYRGMNRERAAGAWRPLEDLGQRSEGYDLAYFFKGTLQLMY